jgi:hypothetical protein
MITDADYCANNPCANGHSWVGGGEGWTTLTAATCVTAAIRTRVCSINAEHKETEDFGEALGHNYTTFGAWTTTTPATCETIGSKTRTVACVNNAEHTAPNEIGEIAELGHDFTVYGVWVITKPATTTEDGSRERTVSCKNDPTHTTDKETDTISKLPPTVSVKDKDKPKSKMLFRSSIVRDKMEIMLDASTGSATAIKFVVYDMTGNIVADGRGREWDLRNRAGRFVSNGAYLVIVEATANNGKVERYSAKLGIKR